MIAAGVDALVLVDDTAADTMVEIIYHAMMRVTYEEASCGRGRLFKLGRRMVG
jgi:hypothetical protein